MKKELKFPNLNEKDAVPVISGSVPETEILRLAKHTLFGLFIIFSISAIIRSYSDSCGTEVVFESVKQIVPSIVTLVLGYYFSRK